MVSIVSGAATSTDANDASTLEREALVHEILREVPLIDGHNNAPWAIRLRVENQISDFEFKDTTVLERAMRTDLERLRNGVAKVEGLNVARIKREAQRVAVELQHTEAPFEVLIEETNAPRQSE
jgi:hypothetical protein